MKQKPITPPKEGESCSDCQYPKQTKTCMVCSNPKADKEHKRYLYPPGYGCNLFKAGKRIQAKEVK